MSLLNNLFSRRENKDRPRQNASSSNVAKERLQLALISDRVNIPPELMETIKEEIIAVISKHFDIDQSGIEISLGERSSHLIANIPVRRTRVLNPRS